MDKFHYEANGYSKAEVNKFIDDVITQTEAIVKKVKAQQVEINNLKEELVKYRSMEDSMKKSLLSAEETGNNIRHQAIEEGKLIVSDAKRNASRIVNDALIRAEKIEAKADILERNVKIFKKKLKLIVDQQLAVVEEIDEIEII